MWLRERGFLEYLCFSTTPKRRERPILWMCPVYVSCFAQSVPDNEDNGLNASRRRAQGRVMARPWTVWKWPGTVARR